LVGEAGQSVAIDKIRELQEPPVFSTTKKTAVVRLDHIDDVLQFELDLFQLVASALDARRADSWVIAPCNKRMFEKVTCGRP
tara:strand:- start:202 stop:447 length:246 start_codon:yes stop_codon:yes gene_type:complete